MDKLTPERRSENMRRIRSVGMAPELMVRSLVHRMGYRYRLHVKQLPGRPDIVCSRLRKVIFVHGCFWHQHADHACKITRMPKSNLNYWQPKLERNKARDTENCAKLQTLGWGVLVIWECQTENHETLTETLFNFLKGV